MTHQPSNPPLRDPYDAIDVYGSTVFLPPLCAMAVTHTEKIDADHVRTFEYCNQCFTNIQRIFTLNACAACNGTGGDVEGDMQGDEHMTAYVEWFIPCVDCIDKGLCPNCGVATLNAEAQADIGSFTCVVCDWHYEAPAYDNEPSMHDFDDFAADDRPYDEAYEGPPGSGLGY